jgi:nucleotide-binding universal stress UspA family protein
MSENGKKILLALDGSNQSLEMVNYAAKSLPPENEVVLFHVMSRVPEPLRDLGFDPNWHKEDKGLMEWEKQQDSRIEAFMEKGRRTLHDAGFPSKAVKVKVRELKEGFARDIAAEALSGYGAVALGRKGMNPLHDAVLGSIASKIAVKLCRIPVWLVGGNPPKGRVLVAMDRSDSAMLAVDHVAKMLNGTNSEIGLLHVVRGLNGSLAGYQKVFMGDYMAKLTREAEERIQPAFDEAIDHMEALGISPERITTKVITGVSSRAGAILKEAESGGYGTIVAGRRGVTRVENYDMGRVSAKLLQMARHQAVWIVGC